MLLFFFFSIFIVQFKSVNMDSILIICVFIRMHLSIWTVRRVFWPKHHLNMCFTHAKHSFYAQSQSLRVFFFRLWLWLRVDAFPSLNVNICNKMKEYGKWVQVCTYNLDGGNFSIKSLVHVAKHHFPYFWYACKYLSMYIYQDILCALRRKILVWLNHFWNFIVHHLN